MKSILQWWKKKKLTTSSNDDFDPIQDFLRRRIDPSNELLDIFVGRGILSREEAECIRSKRSREKKSKELVKCISLKTNGSEFIAALKETGQSYLADCVAGIQASLAGLENNDTQDEKQDTKERWKDVFGRHYEFVIDRMSPDFGLIDRLYSCHILTNEKKNEIEGRYSIQRKNKLILEYLSTESELEKLVQSLEQSDQKHLAKYLEYDGKYTATLDGNWPLTEKEILTIDSNYANLIELLDVCDLIGLLYSTGVINKGSRDFICSKSTAREQNKTLLEILRRSSLRSYWQTICCLHLSNQSHVAKIFETGGVTLRVDAKLEAEGMITNAKEVEIVEQISSLLNSSSITESNRIWEQVMQLKLITAKQGNSIHLYFLCVGSRDVDHLEKIVKNEHLKSIVENLFNHLTKSPMAIRIVLKWASDVFKSCRLPFKAKNRKKCVISQLPSVKISNLPLELLDVFLLKSYFAIIQKRNEATEVRDEEIIRRLASVDYCWFKRMTKERFKKAAWCHLSNLNKEKHQSYLLYKRNQELFEETFFRIRANGKIFKTLRVLSDIELAAAERNVYSVTKKRHAKDNAIRFSLGSNFKDESMMENINKCLHQNGFSSTARVIENGGAAVRIEIKCRNSETPQWRSQLIKRLNNLGDKTIPRSVEVEKLISDLKDVGMEILTSIEDGDVVVWIWCRSITALEKLKSMNESNSLMKVFFGLIKQNQQLIERYITNIDNDLLNVDFVSFASLKVDFEATLDLTEEISKFHSEIYGITKLQNMIFVLCRRKSHPSSAPTSSALDAFNHRQPFSLIKKIELKQVTYPSDIASSEKESSLYIIAHRVGDTTCIWKIYPFEEDNKRSAIWLDFGRDFRPSSLSMSKDSQSLMISMEPSVILRVYDSDAVLLISTSVHPDIVNPFHVVQTSTGNFVVCHRIWKEKMKRKSDSHGESSPEQWNPELDRYMLIVSILSRDGKTIIRSFQPESEAQRLNISIFDSESYLCIDSSDRVFVSDSLNDRVVLLDNNLRWIQTLIPTNEETEERNGRTTPLHPWKFHYDEANKQLVVFGGIEELFHRVNVYSLGRKRFQGIRRKH